jgi:hypothetical protein
MGHINAVRPKFRTFVLTTILLLPGSECWADGFGWWYESFSPAGFQRYFGGGSASDRQLIAVGVQSLFKDDLVNRAFGIEASSENLDRWLELTSEGVSYDGLTLPAARRLDQIFQAAISYDSESPFLDTKPETREYLSPGVLRLALQFGSSPESSLFRFFEFGRSFGTSNPRESCYSEGRAWFCYEAYVILTPAEVLGMLQEVKTLVKNKRIRSSPRARSELKGFMEVLSEVSKKRRGLYLHSTD